MLAPRHLPRAFITVARTFGARGSVLRAKHELNRKTNKFRREPLYSVGMVTRNQEHPFHVNAARLAVSTDRDIAIQRGDRVLNGEYEAYRWSWRSLPNSSDEWAKHPSAACGFPTAQPWWKIPHLNPALGDIKDVWEPARFAWAYDLIRPFMVTGDNRYAAAFYDRFTDWLASSSPFMGPHWSCGQETAIRAVALLYAEAALASAPASNSAIAAALANTLSASGERIYDALSYAISQRNNHAISEAMGLIVLGSRFQGEHPEADRWLALGKECLARLISEQFAPDGWYIQHSFTYLRLALDQCTIAQRALRSRGDSLPAEAISRLGAAIELIVSVMDPHTGIVPNHGANDGAFVHPITLAGYRDFRPSLTAACAMFSFPLPAPITPDRETLAWLGLDPPVTGAPIQDGVRTGKSGWAVARVGTTLVFLRAGTYRSRPGHLDPLHIDVRFDGQEVVVDPGTYAYNAPPPWRNALVTAHVHNGPVLDGDEPGIRGPRFLWYAWPESSIVGTSWTDGVATITAEVPSRLRRVVHVTSGRVIVEDTVISKEARTARVRWLLSPDADPSIVRVEGDSQLLTADEHSVAGWFSPHYGQRLATRYVDVTRDVKAGSRILIEFNSSRT